MAVLLNEYPLPYPPKACVVSGQAEGEMVDFQRVIDSPRPTRLYISRGVLEEVARDVLGMAKGTKVKHLEEQVERVRSERDDLQDVLDTAVALEEKAGAAAVNRKELARDAR